MNPPTAETGSQLITLLASLMLVLQLLLVVQRMLVTNIRIFALQSLLLAAIAGVVGYAYHAGHVYVVAVLTLVRKVLFLPGRLGSLVRPDQNQQENPPVLHKPAAHLLFGAFTLLPYVLPPPLPSL